MTAVWVVGGNGLLGSTLQRVLKQKDVKLFKPDICFNWCDEAELDVQLGNAVKQFAKMLGSETSWQIYWAAGIGTMASTEVELAAETRSLSTLLKLVVSDPVLVGSEGCFAFSSSAGAIYAGSKDEIINEKTSVAPTTDYAREKLKQEKLVTDFAERNVNLTILLARISTLYGSGQAYGKRQGLLAHIARCILRNQCVHIYVPLDTIRDYIAVDDAADMMVAALFAISGDSGVYTKIIASETATTIAEIISVFKRIARRSPRIVASASKLSTLYTRRIQFQSIADPVVVLRSRTSLLVGVAQVLAAERAALTRSRC